MEEKKVKLPELPEGQCNESSQEKINRLIEKAGKTTFNDSLTSKKSFGNPHLLPVLAEMFEVDEMGSNFPKDKFDPKAYSKEAFHENLRWASAGPRKDKS